MIYIDNISHLNNPQETHWVLSSYKLEQWLDATVFLYKKACIWNFLDR